MENIPTYISGTFLAIVAAAVGFMFYAVNFVASGKRNFTPTVILILFCGWIFLVSILTFNGFFEDFSTPPRLMLFVGVTIITIILLFTIRKSRAFLNKIPITTLTYIHIIRVPVEMVLLWLGISGGLGMELTFEGSNFDILAGITAPFVGVFMIDGRNKNRMGAIVWNFAALALLANIVVRAISYTPYFYEQSLGGEPANIAMFYFPFILLPTLVVPIVLFSHLVSLNQLLFVKEPSQF
ncbi:MAG: hypothetical protein ABJP45_06985 [Cyclobacteriaceae bacterium]